MPVPSSISDLSQTPGSNYPTGGESPITMDDYLRTYSAFIAQLRDGKGFTAESTVASASTCDIGAANSLFVQITGTTTITSFGSNYNGPRFVRFAGSLVLTHNASSLILPGGANITTVAGDTCLIVPVGNAATGWRVVTYQSGSSSPNTTGEIKMWPTASPPAGYLICNGSAVSRSTYAALFSVIGTTFGSGDGSTTFNLPNYQDRMPMGVGTIATLAATGGSANAIVPSHTHTYSGTTNGSYTGISVVAVGDHSHSYVTKSSQLVQSGSSTPCWSGETSASTGAAGAHSHSISDPTHAHSYSGTTAPTGSSATNASLPPYLGIHFIIRT